MSLPAQGPLWGGRGPAREWPRQSLRRQELGSHWLARGLRRAGSAAKGDCLLLRAVDGAVRPRRGGRRLENVLLLPGRPERGTALPGCSLCQHGHSLSSWAFRAWGWTAGAGAGPRLCPRRRSATRTRRCAGKWPRECRPCRWVQPQPSAMAAPPGRGGGAASTGGPGRGSGPPGGSGTGGLRGQAGLEAGPAPIPVPWPAEAAPQSRRPPRPRAAGPSAGAGRRLRAAAGPGTRGCGDLAEPWPRLHPARLTSAGPEGLLVAPGPPPQGYAVATGRKAVLNPLRSFTECNEEFTFPCPGCDGAVER